VTETNCYKFKKRAAALAVASCLSVVPWIAEAAGLGRITVFSGLGQPLRAELEIAANKEELAGMAARLAPSDVFSQAGIDYAAALRDLRFSVEKRSNGQAVVKVTSVRPINEPFLDFLVELNWPNGRLVREYTFLLDPPEIATKTSAAPVSMVEAKVVETLRGRDKVSRQTPSPAAPAPAPAPRKESAPAPVPKVAAEAAKGNTAGTHVVKAGETLRKIASENQYQGVSLEQMLIGLYQNNPDAFSGKNINRLKSGAILGIPEKAAVEAVSEAEAKKVYLAHASDWNAYRQKLAGAAAKAPVKEESAGQVSTGKITAKVEEKATPAEQAKDQVKVSRTEAAGKSGAASEADRIAKDKALQEAQSRLVSLEKNVDELQKLLELKNKKLAEMQQAPAKSPEPVKAVEPAKPVELAKPVEEVKPVEITKVPEVVKPVEEAKPVEAPKPVEVKPAEIAQPPQTPPAPEVEEPGFLDSLLGSPLTLFGGAGVLALLAGVFVAKRRRQQQEPSLETTTAPSPSSLGPNSVFRMTGGQSIDTANAPVPTGDFSQTGPGSIDTDEVDPVAEADVYMAYGRDTQAEEILLEALQKDPQRTAIHAKLLEIYANRKSLKQFETLASELYAHTGGVGPEWEKVAELGAGLDPANPLYSGAQSAALASSAGDDTVVRASSPVVAERIEETLDFSPEALDLPLPDDALTALDAPVAEVEEGNAFDFEIPPPPLESEIEAAAEPLPAFDEPYIDTVVTGDSNALDFDLGSAEHPAEPVSEPAAEDLIQEIVDFDLGVVEEESAGVPVPEAAAHASPNFSPEGTMVMPSGGVEAAAVATYVGIDASPERSVAEEPAPQEEPVAQLGDLDFEVDSSTQTVVNFAPGGFSADGFDDMVAAIPEGAHDDNAQLSATVIGPDPDSLEFDVKLTDSVFLGQPMMPTDFDIGSINLDLATDASPPPPESKAADLASEPAPASEEDVARDAHWEQVNTKLELAKAYEEMGDLEGARELLQEVVGEGSVDLVEQARSILGRIGE
jgi:pilus assembly protein FimV